MASFLPSRDLCPLKRLDVGTPVGLARARGGVDQISEALGLAGQERWHALPRRLDQAAGEVDGNDGQDNQDYDEDEGDDEADAFELRYVRSWLTRLISELSMAVGAGSGDEDDDDSQEEVEALFERASELLSACAGKMASGPTTKTHCFVRPDLDLRLPLRDGTLVHDSLGTHTWGAAPMLVHLLLPLVPAPGQAITVLELGAGTGLVGLALAQFLRNADAALDHVVCSTDYHPTVMQNLAHNAGINGWDGGGKRRDARTRFEVRTLDWQAVHADEVRHGHDCDGPNAHPQPDEAYVSTAQTVSSLPQIESELQAHWARKLDDDGRVVPQRFDTLIAADCIYDPEHPKWIRSVAQRYLERRPASPGAPRPLLHLMLPLRPTHARELAAIYEAFPMAGTRPGGLHEELRIVGQADYVGYDDFGAPSLVSSAKGPRRRSANKSTYRWIQIGWTATAPAETTKEEMQ
ncbi:uncharacterized protein PFL1_04032 [Pseudozyma flocculosa PF-1]|uniref:S-adenosylmethionine-dependent methyltransferase n=2 Tax=Pseudozyma flocculosa TaxID=84751 RepID=A0A5C3EU11_9BASI|nr:uncharacterized protein PFL1_04032 [Pseudozyma flocculosa PF-1]EPQ28204.1 hypothetical protein PFL1_04032 [Pseudozyma flocculosa PF-1]SPO35340.1 uncharacterized protein PSFLO_00811 [Pseudozyma flocculosa]